MNDVAIKSGFATFLADGALPFGAVRQVSPGGRKEIIIYVENAGEFLLPMISVQAVHFGKVIVNPAGLDVRLRNAINNAHSSEEA
jgi:hypothetical protein